MQFRMLAKKAVSVTALAAVALGPSVAAWAQSYSSTLDYTVAVAGPNRDLFNAEDLSISGTYSESGPAVSNIHVVELWRNRFGPDDFIGSSNLPRSGSATRTWTNVGGGTYRFEFYKANDGIRITSDNILIFDQDG